MDVMALCAVDERVRRAICEVKEWSIPALDEEAIGGSWRDGSTGSIG